LYLKNLLRFNAIVYIAGGIAFALYTPLMIAMYGILDTGGSPEMYWYTASFARMYGATLFGFGFLTWAASYVMASMPQNQNFQRWISSSMLLANAMGLFVIVVQQVSIWGVVMAWIWITAAVYLIFMVGYIYILVTK